LAYFPPYPFLFFLSIKYSAFIKKSSKRFLGQIFKRGVNAVNHVDDRHAKRWLGLFDTNDAFADNVLTKGFSYLL